MDRETETARESEQREEGIKPNSGNPLLAFPWGAMCHNPHATTVTTILLSAHFLATPPQRHGGERKRGGEDIESEKPNYCGGALLRSETQDPASCNNYSHRRDETSCHETEMESAGGTYEVHCTGLAGLGYAEEGIMWVEEVVGQDIWLGGRIVPSSTRMHTTIRDTGPNTS